MAEKVKVFHVGLGKNASTYLQYRFFPKLQGINYIQRTRYNSYKQIIDKGNEGTYVVSREFDRQYENEVNRIAVDYPDAKIIIILRRHDSWIASQYRRHIKNGFFHDFTEFFDVENNAGLWDRKDVTFYSKLEQLDKLFLQKPLVLFHDELKADPYAFFDRIAAYCGASYNKEDISLKPYHKSYTEKQLRVIKVVAPKLFKKDPSFSKKQFLHYLKFRTRLHTCHLILLLAKAVPWKWVDKKPLLTEDEKQKVRTYYQEDWNKCLAYAEKVNPK